MFVDERLQVYAFIHGSQYISKPIMRTDAHHAVAYFSRNVTESAFILPWSRQNEHKGSHLSPRNKM